jgi:hypothetical protein
MKALAKDPARRYPTGREMAADLRAAASATGERGAGESPTKDEERPGARPIRDDLLLVARRLGSQALRLGRRLGEGGRVHAARSYRTARHLWDEGWRRGPRTRAAMLAGAIVVSVALLWGAFAVIQAIEERRQTPGARMKRAFRSMFSELRLAHPAAAPRDQASAGASTRLS